MPHDALISYSSKDKHHADAICNRLESKGIRCWIAPRDVGLGEYAASIVSAIEASKVMILVYSTNADTSHQVKREVERAVSKGVTIIPVRIDNTEMSKSIEYYVSSVHWIDAMTPPFEQHIDKLVTDLKRLLGRDQVAEKLPKRKKGGKKIQRLILILGVLVVGLAGLALWLNRETPDNPVVENPETPDFPGTGDPDPNDPNPNNPDPASPDPPAPPPQPPNEPFTFVRTWTAKNGSTLVARLRNLYDREGHSNAHLETPEGQTHHIKISSLAGNDLELVQDIQREGPNPLQTFLIDWIQAGNPGAPPHTRQTDFYMEHPTINNENTSRGDLEIDQESFAEKFPNRLFQYMGHSVLDSEPGQWVMVRVEQRMWLEGPSSQQMKDFADQLVLRNTNGSLRIASRSRVR